jgi:hypothetical protein
MASIVMDIRTNIDERSAHELLADPVAMADVPWDPATDPP